MNSTSVFAQLGFWLLVLSSVVLPVCIYAALLAKRAVSRATTLVFGVVLVLLAGGDVYLLQTLAAAARLTTSPSDDALFASEVSVALYLLPALFAGIGINLVSHVLVQHLVEAEARFERERGRRADAPGEQGGD